jgi:deoxyribodipyrimidine photo-lyase
MASSVPEIRIRSVHQCPANPGGDYVLYWMTASRRTHFNFALQRAVEWAQQLRKPLVVLEALRCDYRWASERTHAFFVEGMLENARALARRPIVYYPYVEPKVDAGKGLLGALASQAAVVISDDYPCIFLPRMVRAAAKQVSVRFELVDSNGLLPMRAADRVFVRAFDFRRYLQKHLLEHLDVQPDADPLEGQRGAARVTLPEQVTQRWPMADLQHLAEHGAAFSTLPLDHTVAPVAGTRGGMRAAEQTLRSFLETKLARYGEDRNQPEEDICSRLSPYLRNGHISVHQVFLETTARDGWSVARISGKADGSSTGWWGASAPVESFLDELITWREIGFNLCSQREDYDQYGSLPAWAQQTLAKHAPDRREHVYSLEQFAAADTHDPLWNAAQRQLRREGRIHNYLRMLWGKKVLEWTASPEEALAVLIELNNRYALDGRDPNSYSGIFWCLGRYDRAWGPERPIFGTIRYMSSENTARKVRVKSYLEAFSAL